MKYEPKKMSRKLKNILLKIKQWVKKVASRARTRGKGVWHSCKKHSKKILISAGIFLAIIALVTGGGYFYAQKIISSANTNLKFGFVTDFEYGYKNNVGNKLSNQAPAELEKVVNFYNNEFHPEVVVEGGDMVESSISKKTTTIKQFQEISAIFSRIQAKRGYVFGNHDLRKINKEEARGLLGMNDNHSYFDQGDWRFVLMDTNYTKEGLDLGPSHYIEGLVPEKEFLWLREAFNTEKPILLFSHHSPMPSVIDGALYSNTKNLANGLEMHNFLKQYKNLVLVLSGHDPSFRFQENEGVNYLIVDNLANIDSVGSFASLTAKYNKYTREAKVEIEHHGPSYRKLAVEKKLGDFDFRRLVADFNP